jgi:NAD(P)-dependent dehydrogenase (short-subunit alcohol dehydrogenase family)
VTANCLHPGFVATNFTKGDGLTFRLFQFGARLFAISPEEGAKTTIYLASSPEVEGITGQYFAKSKQAKASAAGRDDAAARRLWELSETMVSAST